MCTVVIVVLKLLGNIFRNKSARLVLLSALLTAALITYQTFWNTLPLKSSSCNNCTSNESARQNITNFSGKDRRVVFSGNGQETKRRSFPVVQPMGPCRLDHLPEGRSAEDGRWYNFTKPPLVLYTYSAFIDSRLSLQSTHPVVRVITVTNGLNITGFDSWPDGEKLSCVLYYDSVDDSQESRREIVKAEVYPWKIGAGWPLNGFMAMEFIVTCPLNFSNTSHLWPRAVALAATNGSIPENCMPVEVPKSITPRQEFVICVPVSFGDLNPWNLIQWLEMQRLLGVAKVIIYNYNISSNALKVLRNYSRQGFVELRYTDGYSIIRDASHYWLHNSPSFNDCMYRNMLRYEYVIALDVDEIILPARHRNLSHLVGYLESIEPMMIRYGLKPSSYLFRNAYYFFDNVYDDASRVTYMRHRRVNVSPYGYASKSITSMQSCIALHNHFCWTPTPAHSGTNHVVMGVEVKLATSRHYKRCHFDQTRCAAYLKNSTVNNDFLRYADELEKVALASYNAIFNVS